MMCLPVGEGQLPVLSFAASDLPYRWHWPVVGVRLESLAKYAPQLVFREQASQQVEMLVHLSVAYGFTPLP